jgi:hypothetical protein
MQMEKLLKQSSKTIIKIAKELKATVLSGNMEMTITTGLPELYW